MFGKKKERLSSEDFKKMVDILIINVEKPKVKYDWKKETLRIP